MVKQYDVKVYGGWRYIKPVDRGGYEWSGSLPNQQPPNCWGMNQWFLLDGMFSGPQSQSELWDEGRVTCPCQELTSVPQSFSL